MGRFDSWITAEFSKGDSRRISREDIIKDIEKMFGLAKCKKNEVELNKDKAEFRLQLLKDKKKLAAELRQKFGYFGTDDQTLRNARNRE